MRCGLSTTISAVGRHKGLIDAKDIFGIDINQVIVLFTLFITKILAGKENIDYLCNVFFIVLDLRLTKVPTAITYDKKSRQSSLVSDFMTTFATPAGVLFASVGQTRESSSCKNKHSGKQNAAEDIKKIL